MATHSVLSLGIQASAAIGLSLLAAGHASGWPILRGGAQALPDAGARYLEDLGGRVEIGHKVTQLPGIDLVLASITAHNSYIAGPHLPSCYRRRLEQFPVRRWRL